MNTPSDRPERIDEQDSWEGLAEDLFGIDFKKSREDGEPDLSEEDFLIEEPPASRSEEGLASPVISSDESTEDVFGVVSEPDAAPSPPPLSAADEQPPEEPPDDTAEESASAEEAEEDTYWDVLGDWERGDQKSDEPAPRRSAPRRSAPSRSAPSRSAPSRSAPSRSAPSRSAPKRPAAREASVPPAARRAEPITSSPVESRPDADDEDFGSGVLEDEPDAIVFAKSSEEKTVVSSDGDEAVGAFSKKEEVTLSEEEETTPSDNDFTWDSETSEDQQSVLSDETVADPAVDWDDESGDAADTQEETVGKPQVTEPPAESPAEPTAESPAEPPAESAAKVKKPRRRSRRRRKSVQPDVADGKSTGPAAADQDDEKPTDSEDLDTKTDVPEESTASLQVTKAYSDLPTWEEAISYLLDPSQVGAKEAVSGTPESSAAKSDSAKPAKPSGRRRRRR